MGAIYSDYPMVLIIIVGAILLTALGIYLPENKYHLIVSQKNNKLSMFRGKELEREWNLDNIKKLISKRIRRRGDRKHELIIEDNSGGSHVLFDLNDIYISSGQWHNFAESLAKIIDKEYVKEAWREASDGKLHLLPPEELKAFTYRKIVFYPLIIAIPFMGAIGYNYWPSVSSFLGFGFATAVVNIPLSLLSATKSEQETNMKIMVPVLFVKGVAIYVMSILMVKLYFSDF
ncbi:hypothetical protein GTO10_00360 [Candidatus Saccharibacteria bacterium]|nr:hypothetical protein [Candidatus Saccharibacteria bacterium]